MIPMRLLPSTFSILTKTSTVGLKSGQQNDTWTPTCSGIRCRLDENKGSRYVSQTADMQIGTHTLLCNSPLPVVLDVKQNQIQIDSVNYRIVGGVSPVYRLLNVPDHYEIQVVRYS
jgi:hypothetical protein